MSSPTPNESARAVTRAERARAGVARSRATPSARTGVERSVAMAASELSQALQLSRHPERAAYERCRERMRSECIGAHAAVLYDAMAESGIEARVRADGYGITPWIAERGAAYVANELAGVMAASSDPAERIAALLLLTSRPELESSATATLLPEASYRELALRPIPEVKLIGELHRAEGIESPVVQAAFSELATSVDLRARRTALVALGHPESAATLNDVLEQNALSPAEYATAATSASKCGLPCADALTSLLDRDDRHLRLAVYESVGLAPEGEEAALRELVLAHGGSELDSDELALRRELLGGETER